MKAVPLALVAAAVLFAGCRRADVREFAVSIPEMVESDRAAIEGALRMYGGVDHGSYSFDFEKKVLTLRYDSMQIAKKNIEMAVAAVGLAANGVTPESVGAKPRERAK